MEIKKLYSPEILAYMVSADANQIVSLVLEDPRTGEKVGDLLPSAKVEEMIRDLSLCINKRAVLEDI